jgi:hypothetical protein
MIRWRAFNLWRRQFDRTHDLLKSVWAELGL